MAGPRTATRHRRDPDRRFTVLGLGAILLVAVIGYIAYTANSGLPLQGRDRLRIEVPSANRLIKSADVRIGGIRVGQVTDVDAVAVPGRRPYARLDVALDPSVGRVPVDSTAQVRPASVLGLTYVDLKLGHSADTIADEGTLPLSRARTASNLTDLFDVFDRSSAARFRRGLRDISGGLAGRGTAINATIAGVSRLLPPLTRVADTLAAPATQLPGFLRGYEATVAALGPVRDQLAGVVSGGARTFGAFAAERDALGRSIALAPAAEDAVTGAFTRARPALDGLAKLAVDLRPAARRLPRTIGRINQTIAAGVAPLKALPSLAAPLSTALDRLDTLSRDSNTSGTLRKLTELLVATKGALSILVPAQVHCNVVSLFVQGFAGTFGTLGTGDGPALGGLFLGETGAIGEPVQNAKPGVNVGANPLPHLNAQECESGNEPWTDKQQLGNPVGLQSSKARDTAPPPGVQDRAREAGLMTDPEGIGR